MKRHALVVSFTLIFLVLTGCTVYHTGPPPGAPPPAPPVVTIAEPAFLYLVPSLNVYFVPGVTFDILYYNGLWYYNVRGYWYWGHTYRGPWSYMRPERIPKVLRRLPPDYRSRHRRDHYRVPYGHWKKRWNTPPPQTKYKPPPYMYKVPRSKVYAYPGIPSEIFYHQKRWYNRFQGVWYWSWSYNGPWAWIEVQRVPDKIRDLPRQPYDRDNRYEKVPWEKGKKKWWDDD